MVYGERSGSLASRTALLTVKFSSRSTHGRHLSLTYLDRLHEVKMALIYEDYKKFTAVNFL